MTWGGAGFSRRQIEQYRLEPFLEELPLELIVVGERACILPSYRGSTVVAEMGEQLQPFIDAHDVRVVFGCCEPHLLSLYLAMGQRTYAEHNINSPSAGYLIPLVSFVPDVDALRGVGQDTCAGGCTRVRADDPGPRRPGAERGALGPERVLA